MAAKKPRRIYWDSTVYIHRIQQTPDRIDVLNAISDAAEAGSIVFLASTLVLAEVAKTGQIAGKDEEEKVKKLADLWENEFFVIQGVDRAIALKAAEYVRNFGLKPSDAIHVATALALGANELQTYDEGVLSRDGRIGHPALSIKKPSHPSPLPLFDAHEEEDELELAAAGLQLGPGEDSEPKQLPPASAPMPPQKELGPGEGSKEAESGT